MTEDRSYKDFTEKIFLLLSKFCIIILVFVINTTSLPRGPIQPSSPSTKELHASVLKLIYHLADPVVLMLKIRPLLKLDFSVKRH